MSINDRVPSDATKRRGGGSGKASQGPSPSEKVPVDSTNRINGSQHGKASQGTVPYSHTDGCTK